MCGGKPTYEIEKILGWLERNNYDYVFCGDDQTEIGGFSSLQNYKINSLNKKKKEEISPLILCIFLTILLYMIFRFSSLLLEFQLPRYNHHLHLHLDLNR